MFAYNKSSLRRFIVSNDLNFTHIQTQNNLESAILRYQNSLLTSNKQLIEKCYKEVCKIYPPLMHMQEWWNQYHYLYDSHEDFESDYIKIFCNVLSNWKPRSKRKQSRYNGTGEFKNYFIGALQHNYINLVKADNAGKRNPSQKCPICETWVNPLSTHVLNHHQDLLWEYLLERKINVNLLDRCSFCKTHKMPKTYVCYDDCPNIDESPCESCIRKKKTELIKKHLISKHSSLLFQRFNDLYPNYQTVSPRALSVYMSEENDDDENCYYDQMKDDSKLESLLMMKMTTIESTILRNALNSNSQIKYDHKLYNCTIDEFNNALDNIKSKMALFGIEG